MSAYADSSGETCLQSHYAKLFVDTDDKGRAEPCKKKCLGINFPSVVLLQVTLQLTLIYQKEIDLKLVKW